MEIAAIVLGVLILLAALFAWGWFCYHNPVLGLLLTLFMD